MEVATLLTGLVVVEAALVPCRDPFAAAFAAGAGSGGAVPGRASSGPLRSLITGLPIRGKALVLEDGAATVSAR